MEDYHIPICTHCYAVRVEPQRAKSLRPTCAACGELLAKQRKHTVVPMPKSNYILVTDLSLLQGLNSSHKGGGKL
jgi:transposase-like protein